MCNIVKYINFAGNNYNMIAMLVLSNAVHDKTDLHVFWDYNLTLR